MLCKQTHENIIRFSPPLIAEKSDIDQMLGMIETVLVRMSK